MKHMTDKMERMFAVHSQRMDSLESVVAPEKEALPARTGMAESEHCVSAEVRAHEKHIGNIAQNMQNIEEMLKGLEVWDKSSDEGTGTVKNVDEASKGAASQPRHMIIGGWGQGEERLQVATWNVAGAR